MGGLDLRGQRPARLAGGLVRLDVIDFICGMDQTAVEGRRRGRRRRGRAIDTLLRGGAYVPTARSLRTTASRRGQNAYGTYPPDRSAVSQTHWGAASITWACERAQQPSCVQPPRSLRGIASRCWVRGASPDGARPGRGRRARRAYQRIMRRRPWRGTQKGSLRKKADGANHRDGPAAGGC